MRRTPGHHYKRWRARKLLAWMVAGPKMNHSETGFGTECCTICGIGRNRPELARPEQNSAMLWPNLLDTAPNLVNLGPHQVGIDAQAQ